MESLFLRQKKQHTHVGVLFFYGKQEPERRRRALPVAEEARQKELPRSTIAKAKSRRQSRAPQRDQIPLSI